MSAARDLSNASWRVKLRRAEEHFREFQVEAARYMDRHPYEIRREHQGKPKTNHWRYVFRITEQPNPRLAAIMGDVLHNARAALDHLFCAMLPRKRRTKMIAGFPVVRSSIWKDETGLHIADDKERESFDSAVRGLQTDAVAVLCQLQPGASKAPELHPLGIFSGLENLDKHRNLIALTFVLLNAESIITRAGENIGGQQPAFCEDGTVVARFGFRQPREMPPEAEVSVDVRGTPQIAVKIAVKKGRAYGDASTLLRILVEDLPRTVVPALEAFIRP